ncbi:MAG: DUF4465 domain-containing protein [Chitinophagia bacterium]|nr:DUF4465 domain-containing protein [Chitinophagia bacterium]
MRSLLLFALLLIGMASVQAQTTIIDFESLTLPGSDTAYINYVSIPGSDVGFTLSNVHFPCVFDTGWGGSRFWSSGFAYSNRTDTNGYPNLYSSITHSGYGGSSKYLVAWNVDNYIKVAQGLSTTDNISFYITNSTYAYKSMKYGDAFAKKFGGASGTDPDWFKLTIRGYLRNMPTRDSVEVYLADYRSSISDTILKSWQWVNLAILGAPDSITFHLSSSDTSGIYINTPAFFCMDNFKYDAHGDAVASVYNSRVAKTYPNPTTESLTVELLNDSRVQNMTISNMMGIVVKTLPVTQTTTTIDISSLPVGNYLLQLYDNKLIGSQKFEKR